MCVCVCLFVCVCLCVCCKKFIVKITSKLSAIITKLLQINMNQNAKRYLYTGGGCCTKST